MLSGIKRSSNDILSPPPSGTRRSNSILSPHIREALTNSFVDELTDLEQFVSVNTPFQDSAAEMCDYDVWCLRH